MSEQLSEKEITVYIALWESDYRFLADVARDTELTPVDVSRAIQALERAGALTCQRSNRRVVPGSIKVIKPEELIQKLPCARLLPYLD